LKGDNAVATQGPREGRMKHFPNEREEGERQKEMAAKKNGSNFNTIFKTPFAIIKLERTTTKKRTVTRANALRGRKKR